MRSTSFGLVLLGIAACGGQSAPDGGGGGGGVSFGGAQDIGEFRSILDQGKIPGPETLDANGFFNEHFNAPPPAACGGKLCLTPGLTVGRDWLTGEHQATLEISVNTNVDPSTFKRLPMNLVVVVDHSGSMASDGRLVKVKSGLDTLIDNLQSDDRLAIISFDDVVTTNAPFTPATDKVTLHQVVASLEPRGGTNIFEGLKAGFEMLGETPANERQNRVIFLSDGLATVGITDQGQITQMATDRIMRGIGLTTIGVGNDFDVELMRGLAERGAGNFYYLEDATAATEVFTEELDFFMSPLAMDIKIDAATTTGWAMDGVVGSRLWSNAGNSGSMQIPAVFLASRTSQGGEIGRRGGGSMIFVHMDPAAAHAGRVADLHLSYRLPGQTERVTQTVSLDYATDPLETPEQPYLSSSEMTERFAMYQMFLGLKAATIYAKSDWNCAAAALIATKRNATTWSSEHTDPDLAADLKLLDKFLANLRTQGANVETSDNLASCATSEPPPWGGNDDWSDSPHPMYGCYSASRASTGSWLLILGVVVAVVRRRRLRRTKR